MSRIEHMQISLLLVGLCFNKWLCFYCLCFNSHKSNHMQISCFIHNASQNTAPDIYLYKDVCLLDFLEYSELIASLRHCFKSV